MTAREEKPVGANAAAMDVAEAPAPAEERPEDMDDYVPPSSDPLLELFHRC